MKSLVKVILYLLGFLVAKVFNVKWAHKFKMLHRYLYTYWVIQNFKRTGRNVIIGSFQYLREPDKIVLGDNVAIGQHCILNYIVAMEIKGLLRFYHWAIILQ